MNDCTFSSFNLLAVFLHFLDVNRGNCERANNLFEIENSGSNHSRFYANHARHTYPELFGNVTLNAAGQDEVKQKVASEARSFNVNFDQNRRISPYMSFYVPVSDLGTLPKPYNGDVNSLHLNPVSPPLTLFIIIFAYKL